MNDAQPLISASHVSAGYAGQRIIAGVDLHLVRNEVVALMGASGCGKTTLLRVLAGLLPAEDGSVETALREEGFSVMFQAPLLQPWLTVKKNILLPCRIAGVRGNAVPLLEAVGLSDSAGKFPWQLSGGMQRRVALARSLVLAPTVLLMDEPFSGVDELAKEALCDLLSFLVLERNLTCLFTTHSPYDAVFLADRIAIMGNDPGHPHSTIRFMHNVALDRPRGEHTRRDPCYQQEVTTVRDLLSDVSRQHADNGIQPSSSYCNTRFSSVERFG